MSLFNVSHTEFGGIEFLPISKLTYEEFMRYYDAMDLEYKMLWQMNYTYVMTSENQQKSHWYKIIDDMLCIFQKYKNGMAMLFLPIGDCDQAKMTSVLHKCFDIMKACSSPDYDIRVDWVNSEQLLLLDDSFKVSKMMDKKTQCKDYIYDPYMVANLAGHDFEYVRRKINRFKKLYPEAITRPYEPADKPGLMDLAKQWKQYVMKDVGRYFFVVDGNYYKNTIEMHEKLNHEVFVVEYKGKIIGMISGGWIIEGEYAWCFNRKPLNEYEGLSEYLVWFICDHFKTADYLNDGSGSAGLSFFKERFRPTIVNELFIVHTKKSKEGT